MEYLVKITSNIYILHFLLFVLVENHIFYTCDLGIDFLTFKMTSKMTFNHLNNITNGFSRQKSHRKEVLHLFVVLSVTNHIFHLIDLEIEVLTLTMTFNHQNNTRNGLLNPITSNINITLLVICVC